MKVSDVYGLLDSVSSFGLQESWDNSGLNLGSMDSEFDRVYASLELDFHVLSHALDHSLVVTHHPLMFKSIKNFNVLTYPCNLISECIRKRISVISMHTNFDKTHLNDHFVDNLKLDLLGFERVGVTGFSVVLETSVRVFVAEIALHVKNTLGLAVLRYSKASDSPVDRIYVTCGSNAQAFNIASENSLIITGDIRYHDAKMANSQRVSFIDVPHFDSECSFSSLIHLILQKHGIEAIILRPQNPFCYI